MHRTAHSRLEWRTAPGRSRRPSGPAARHLRSGSLEDGLSAHRNARTGTRSAGRRRGSRWSRRRRIHRTRSGLRCDQTPRSRDGWRGLGGYVRLFFDFWRKGSYHCRRLFHFCRWLGRNLRDFLFNCGSRRRGDFFRCRGSGRDFRLLYLGLRSRRNRFRRRGLGGNTRLRRDRRRSRRCRLRHGRYFGLLGDGPGDISWLRYLREIELRLWSLGLSGGFFHTAALTGKKLLKSFRLVGLYRTGVRFLLRDAYLRQRLQDRLTLYFQLPG